MSTPIAGGASLPHLQQPGVPGRTGVLGQTIIPSLAGVIVGVVFIVCLVLIAFGLTYLQNTWLGLALSFAGVLVGYESLYLLRKLTRRRSTD